MLNENDKNDKSASGSSLSVNSKPKLENVAEWIKKSFDQSQKNSAVLLTTVVNSTGKSKSSHFLGTQKQHRSNSVTTHTNNGRIIVTDEPLIEINLNRNFYLKKQQKSQDELEEHRNNRSSFSLSNAKSSHLLPSNLMSNSYAAYSKSHTPFITNDKTGSLSKKP